MYQPVEAYPRWGPASVLIHTQLSIAWPIAQGKRAGVFIAPIPGAKSRKHIEENVRAAGIVLTADDLAEIDRIVPPGAASGTRYPIGQMHRLNV
jgi:diketogulonate reductase-like aldo/keto reductase